MRINTKLLFPFVVLIFIDQISKYLLSNSICNQNIAWSIPIAPAIFYLAWIIIVSALILFFLKTKKATLRFFLIFIFAGALSNLIDRIHLGCVVDYIDLKFWPVFNLADIYITIGVIFFLFSTLKSKIQNPKVK